MEASIPWTGNHYGRVELHLFRYPERVRIVFLSKRSLSAEVISADKLRMVEITP